MYSIPEKVFSYHHLPSCKIHYTTPNLFEQMKATGKFVYNYRSWTSFTKFLWGNVVIVIYNARHIFIYETKHQPNDIRCSGVARLLKIC